MSSQPFIYFLRWATRYHQVLQARFTRESKRDHTPEVKALLVYLAQHEGALARIIDAYEHDAPHSLLNAWFKISPNLSHVVNPDSIRFDLDWSVSEVIDRVLKIDEGLIQVYEMLLRQANSAELRQALEGLIDGEKREEIRLMACEMS